MNMETIAKINNKEYYKIAVDVKDKKTTFVFVTENGYVEYTYRSSSLHLFNTHILREIQKVIMRLYDVYKQMANNSVGEVQTFNLYLCQESYKMHELITTEYKIKNIDFLSSNDLLDKLF